MTESVILLSLTVDSPAVWAACDSNVTNNLQYTLLIDLSCVICSSREEDVMKYAGKSDPVDVMGHLRKDKDMFRAKH